jgi:hypothetical protein
MGQDVTVLFSSPCKTRWKSRKEGSNCVGLGVEVPSDAECLEIRKLLYRETPICLCDPSDRNYTQINACLNVLGLDGKAEDYERKRLFGNQFRYLFGDSGDILVGLDGLKTAIMKYAHDGILVPYDNTVESVASHKLMQLNFDLDRRAFYHMFVSGLVIFLAVKKLQDLEEIKMCKNLLQYEEQDEVMYGKIFEKHVILKIERGVSFLARSLEGQENSEFSFSPSKTVFFTYAIYTPIQIWFQDINHTSLLGFTLINRNTLFYPTGPRCYTVDAILVEKFTNRIVVNFIQATVSKNHSVSPGGFFAMFMFVKLISIANKCDVDVTFIFVVPENIFDVFQSSEAEYLHSLFEDVEIFVMKINDGEQNNAVLSGIHSLVIKI